MKPEESRTPEMRLRAAVESAPNGLLMVDLLIPEVLRAGDARSPLHFLSDPRVRAMEASRDLYGRRKDGTRVPAEIGLNPIETDDGTFILSSIVDISERKQEEAERTELGLQLHPVQKMGAVGTLAGGDRPRVQPHPGRHPRLCRAPAGGSDRRTSIPGAGRASRIHPAGQEPRGRDAGLWPQRGGRTPSPRYRGPDELGSSNPSSRHGLPGRGAASGSLSSIPSSSSAEIRNRGGTGDRAPRRDQAESMPLPSRAGSPVRTP